MSSNNSAEFQPFTSAPECQGPDEFFPPYTCSQVVLPQQALYTSGAAPPALINEQLQNLIQVTMDNLQGIFSTGSILGDSHLQGRMNRSQWIPLEEIHNDYFCHLGVTFEFLQECATRKMYRLDSNFELDSTRTFIRPVWAKVSHIKFGLNLKFRISKTGRTNIARKLLSNALESVANSQQIAFENQNVEIIMFGTDPGIRWYTAYFNAPAIPSLIKSFLNEYSDGVVRIIEISDSIFLPIEYPERRREERRTTQRL